MKKSTKKKSEVILNADEIIKTIKKNYGPNPVFSSKYESVKKSVMARK